MIPSTIFSQRSYPYFFCLLFIFASCTKDGAEIVETEEIPVDNVAKIAANNLYDDYYVASMSTTADIAWTGDEPSCDPGTVPQGTRDKILTRLAYFRLAAGLNNTVSENPSKSNKAQLAALMMHANGELDHFPPITWKCYTADGNDGAGNSLLTISKNAEAIDSYVRDHGPANGPVGHRRWLLWPRLQEIGIGNSSVANAIWVLGNPGTPPTDAPEFVAWPPEGYVPNTVVYPRWSFSIKDADFTSAEVSMRDQNGNPVALTIEALDTQFGDPTIVWVPNGIQLNASDDVLYSVNISNVGVDGVFETFDYQVILFDVNG